MYVYIQGTCGLLIGCDVIFVGDFDECDAICSFCMTWGWEPSRHGFYILLFFFGIFN